MRASDQQARARLALGARVSSGGVASFGFQHEPASTLDPHALNSASSAKPTQPNGMLGAKVSFGFK
ncbi:MAG: hypothetical protein ACYC8V_04670 [Caulobacteraceae bacterium]